MNWRDFFYFSKGERRGLTLLLCLLTILWIVLSVSQNYHKENKSEIKIITDTIRGKSTLNIAKTAKKKLIKKQVSLPNKSQNQLNKKQFYTPQKKTITTYQRNKYQAGTIVELNSADTLTLKKVPGIGSSFSRRIVKYRNLLGGFYNVNQLKEVYGIDEEKYQQLKKWFYTDTTLIRKVKVNKSNYYELNRHPYLNKEQAKAICNQRKQKSRLSGWENLLLLNEFSTKDVDRLSHYLSFE